jgi:hypothetical protein
MIYNGFGEDFYVKGSYVRILNDFIIVCSPWFMPLMFVIAGISCSYALQKRTATEFVKERFLKLFLPLLSGILLYLPAQTYFAERFHNDYTGSYLGQYLLFFTKETDLTGYSGGFTPGHLWFILYLFVISLLALPIMMLCKQKAWTIPGERLTILKVIPLFLVTLFMTPLIDISGKSLSEFFTLFMLGFFILSKDELLNRLEKNRFYLMITAILLSAIRLYFFYHDIFPEIVYDVYYRMVGWICILAILGIGKHILNNNNPVTRYLAKASFPVYYFHQTWLVAVAYYVFQFTPKWEVQSLFIILGSILFTFLNYEVFRRIPLTRFLFGIKK